MDVLTELQKKFLAAMSATRLKESFWLTGGTALSAFYLKHRLSDDLDFFTAEPGVIPGLNPELEKLAPSLGATLTVRRQFRSYLEIVLDSGSERLRIDFAVDSPYRLEPARVFPPWEIPIDNAVDISCNKLSALFDRNDPKDFVDIYFIDREILPLPRLIPLAKKKHIGMDDYWLAVSFGKVASMTILPRMIRPVTIPELQEFFASAARTVLEGKYDP